MALVEIVVVVLVGTVVAVAVAVAASEIAVAALVGTVVFVAAAVGGIAAVRLVEVFVVAGVVVCSSKQLVCFLELFPAGGCMRVF